MLTRGRWICVILVSTPTLNSRVPFVPLSPYIISSLYQSNRQSIWVLELILLFSHFSHLSNCDIKNFILAVSPDELLFNCVTFYPFFHLNMFALLFFSIFISLLCLVVSSFLFWPIRSCNAFMFWNKNLKKCSFRSEKNCGYEPGWANQKAQKMSTMLARQEGEHTRHASVTC